MDNTQATLLASIIGVTGTLAGAAMQAYGRDLLDFFHIGTLKLPYLKGEWDATWYVEEFGVERIYTIDMVQISRQHKIIFSGLGIDPRWNYTIKGQINSHGIVTFSYDFERIPYALVGGGVLLPNATVTELTGMWHGYVQEGKLMGGRVVLRKRIKQ